MKALVSNMLLYQKHIVCYRIKEDRDLAKIPSRYMGRHIYLVDCFICHFVSHLHCLEMSLAHIWPVYHHFQLIYFYIVSSYSLHTVSQTTVQFDSA
jgi:hypothetical protein